MVIGGVGVIESMVEVATVSRLRLRDFFLGVRVDVFVGAASLA